MDIYWDLRCNTCFSTLNYHVINGDILINYVKLIRDIKTNNAMPEYMMQHLLDYIIKMLESINPETEVSRINLSTEDHLGLEINLGELGFNDLDFSIQEAKE